MVPFPEAPVWSSPAPSADTPYALASVMQEPRRGTKRLLVEMSKALEAQAAAAGQAMIVVGTFQHAQHFTDTTSQRWRDLADVTVFAGVYGLGLSHMATATSGMHRLTPTTISSMSGPSRCSDLTSPRCSRHAISTTTVPSSSAPSTLCSHSTGSTWSLRVLSEGRNLFGERRLVDARAPTV